MPGGGDGAPEGEEPLLPAGGGGGREDVLPGQRGGGGEESGEELSAAREAGQEEEEEASGSHDLSSSANYSPGCTTGSASTSTKRKMTMTVAEMKKRLPSEKRSRSKASTVEALKYALNCVKQVQANSEYYKLLMSTGQERRDATVCSLEELDRVTSEHTLKNTDSFVVGFSLTSGRVLYFSGQAPSMLCCRRTFLESARFVDLLFHQDVNVFYSHTAQPHLPPWTSSHTAAVLFDRAQVKSFFCRIRGGKDGDGEMLYNPFRITPYLLKVQGGGASGGEEEPCCLALAERITSGYEAPRIPMDKRIFTTTHTPGCVFLEVDDRAVPLLGYLPQDLIGTSLLTRVHPEDRPLMLSMHSKVLKYAGQPSFEHSPMRLRCQNGEYVTMETSWSSFINPWSRKVAFIIGRHKVRTSPLNEDVFAARSKDDQQITYEEVKHLQAKIYKLFVQPVYKHGSSGYGSLGSNVSHEHYISVASSSDSNGNLWEESHRSNGNLWEESHRSNGNLWEESHREPLVCADVNRVNSWGQQAFLDSRKELTSLGIPAPGLLPQVASGAQVRGQEESRKQTHVPSYQQINCVDSIIRYLESCTGPALKSKSESHSLITSSSSSSTSEDDKPTDMPQASSDVVVVLDSQVSVGSMAAAVVVGAPLTDVTLSTKALSVTSQRSYSSTIVHVPEVTALEDAPTGSDPADPAPPPARPGPAPSPACEEPRLVGLTKEVLSDHTHREEQEYVHRLRQRILLSPYSSYLQQHDHSSPAASHPPADHAMRPASGGGGWPRPRTGKPKHKRPKPQGSSDSYTSPPGPPRCPPLLLPRRPAAAPDSSWPSSDSSHPSSSSHPYPSSIPPRPHHTLYYPPPAGAQPGAWPGGAQQAGGWGGGGVALQPDPNQQRSHPAAAAPPAQNVPGASLGYPPLQNPQGFGPYAPAPPMMTVVLPGYPAAAMYPPHSSSSSFSFSSFSAPNLLPQAPYAATGSAPGPHPVPQTPPGEGEEADPPPPAGWATLVSSSRSSSPLQLNLLQEELPLPGETSSSGHARPEGPQEQRGSGRKAPGDTENQDGQSTSSELLDLLLQEDARSGTGSNASGSLGSGSGSNRTSTSHTESSDSCKYFSSTGSSDTSGTAHSSQEATAQHPPPSDTRVESSVWGVIQNTPEAVMMTYQILPRARSAVLAEDLQRLGELRPRQPWFSLQQREELAMVHPWIQQHAVPHQIDTQGCVGCTLGAGLPPSPLPPAPDSSSHLASPEPECSPMLDN